MAGTVDGTKTAADAHGVIQGNGGAIDKIAGAAGGDRLEGHAAFNQYYGGAGNDTFIISHQMAVRAGAHEGASTKFADEFAYITDFGGAGGWTSTNNDFVAFTGFSAGSTLTLVSDHASGKAGAHLLQYTITDAASGDVFNVLINSVNGKALGKGDYAFY